MTTPQQAYIWANGRTGNHTAKVEGDMFFELRKCAAPVDECHAINEYGAIRSFVNGSKASEYVASTSTRLGRGNSYNMGYVVDQPTGMLTHWIDSLGGWWKLRYLGRKTETKLAKDSAVFAMLPIYGIGS